MPDTQTQAFIQTYLPDARIAAGQLGMPVSVILAQWIDETGAGTSSAFQKQNNFAGVSLGGKIESFKDKTAGLIGYIIRWGNPVYAPTLNTIHQAGNINADPILAAQAVEASPWAAGHYNGNGLENIITQNNLTQYDQLGALQPPPGVQKAVNAAQDPGAILPTDGSGTNSGSNASTGFYGCPEGKIWDGPSIGGSRIYLTKCEGRAWLGAVSIMGGAGLLLIGIGVIGLGTRTGRGMLGAAVAAV